MFKNLIFLFIALIQSHVIAQDEDLTRVSVGSAEIQIDKMFIPEPIYGIGIKPAEVKLLKELSDMMGQGTPEYEDILANIKGIQISRDLDTQLMCYPTCKKSY